MLGNSIEVGTAIFAQIHRPMYGDSGKAKCDSIVVQVNTGGELAPPEVKDEKLFEETVLLRYLLLNK